MTCNAQFGRSDMRSWLVRSLALCPVILVVGCAHSSDEIAAQPVPTSTYDSYECARIASEGDRISARLAELKTEVDETADDDELTTTVGILVFPPLLFFLKGDGAEADEYGRLKGEYAALQERPRRSSARSRPRSAAIFRPPPGPLPGGRYLR
ncbi:MAG: metal ABC transporter ATP-binding protein [Rhodomicrobium sp.]|nr:metal ABC transporter ATP-binding protein [Rhodomicrobium sp.]